MTGITVGQNPVYHSLQNTILDTMILDATKSTDKSSTENNLKTICRSVWSFWTKPFHSHRNSIWCSEKHHLLCWILSLETARQHYPQTMLVTDDMGADLLIDGLGLEFDDVSTELNELQSHDPDWWILGKLWAYRCQTEPFVHVDSDVFLWKPLPASVATAPVLAQNPEYFVFGEHTASCWWYRPDVFNQLIRETNGWLPAEWDWAICNRSELAYCCGIVGGTQTDFISYYADLALKIATHSRNQTAFALMENKPGDCLLIEQYLLAVCLEYYKQQNNSKFPGLHIECLFESPQEAFSLHQPEKLGYTHLIGPAKQDLEIAYKVEKRVAQEYPTQYERCLRYLKTIQILPSVHHAIHSSSAKAIDPQAASDPQADSAPAGGIQASIPVATHTSGSVSPPDADLTPVDYQAWVSLFTQLRDTLRDRFVRQALFVETAPSESDKTLIYFALQDICQVCMAGIIQARINQLNVAGTAKIMLTLVETQRSFLEILENYNDEKNNLKDKFIDEYRNYINTLEDKLKDNIMSSVYSTQKDIIYWLGVWQRFDTGASSGG